MSRTRRKSCRLEKKAKPCNLITPNQQNRARMNSILCKSRLRCADIPRNVRQRLQINSCSRCDLFNCDVPLKKQDEVCQRRYGCRRETDQSYEDMPLKVRICWSSGGRRKTMSVDLDVARRVGEQKEQVKRSRPLNALKIHAAKKKRKIEIEAYVCRSQKLEKSALVKLLRDRIVQKESDLVCVCTEKEDLVSANLKKYEEIKSKILEIKNTKKILTEMVATNDVLTEENKQLILREKQQKRKISYLTQRIQKLHQERKNENLVTTINTVLKGVRYDKRANMVLDLMYSGDLFGASSTAVGELFARDIMKKNFQLGNYAKLRIQPLRDI